MYVIKCIKIETIFFFKFFKTLSKWIDCWTPKRYNLIVFSQQAIFKKHI